MIETLLKEFIETLENAQKWAVIDTTRTATFYAEARESLDRFFDEGAHRLEAATPEQLEQLLKHLPILIQYLLTLPTGFNQIEHIYQEYIDNRFPLSKISRLEQANYYLARGHALLRCQHYVAAQKAYYLGLQITVYCEELWAQEKTQTFLRGLRSIEAVLLSNELMELEVQTPVRAYNEPVALFTRLRPMLSHLHSEAQWEMLHQLYGKLKPWIVVYYKEHIAISPLAKKQPDSDSLMIAFSLACDWLKQGYYNAALAVLNVLKNKSTFPKATEARDLAIWIKGTLEPTLEVNREIKPEAKPQDTKELLFLLPTITTLAKVSREASSQALLASQETPSIPDYHQRLKTIQTTLFSARTLNTDIVSAQKTFSAEITTLLQDLWRQSEALLYTPPCGFEIIALGSLGRGEFGPASDVDIAIMITDKGYRQSKYFRTLVNIFNTKLKTLGIAQPIDSNDDAHLGADEKRPDFDFIDTPEGFAKRYAPALIRKGEAAPAENYAIYHAMSLYPTEQGRHFLEQYRGRAGCSLLGHYQQQLLGHLGLKPGSAALTLIASDEKSADSLSQNHRDVAKHYFVHHQEDLASAIKWHSTNIKERYLAPLTYACFNLMLYAGLHEEALATTVPAAIEKLKDRVFTQAFAADMLKAWQDLQRIRIQLHEAWLKHRWKVPSLKDNTYLEHGEAINTEFCLIEIQLSRLSQINRLILQPLYIAVLGPRKESKEAISPTSSFMAWIDSPNQTLLEPVRYELEQGLLTLPKELLIPKLENWVELLCERQASIAMHRGQYQRLPDEYKEAYYKALKNLAPLPNLLNAIAAVPFKDGTSIAYIEAQTQWQTFLSQQFTVRLPVEEKTPTKELTKQFPEALLVQWLNAEGRVCSGFLQSDFQAAWQRVGYLKRDGFDLKQIKASTDSKAEISASKIDGRGYVFPILDKQGHLLAYAKLYPEMPGRQALAESLAWHVSGYGAVSTLCKVTHLATGQVYPLLISQFKGETLQNHLRYGTLTTSENELDAESFTLKFLETLLLSYEDDKFDNIALESFVNSDGQIRYRLISFDADRAFAEPFLKEELTERNILRKQLKINAKSAVYCLEAMKQKLHSNVVTRFKEMQPLTLFTHWLQEPLATHLMGRLFSQTEAIQLSQDKMHECFIPAVFELGTISRLYQRFLRIQAALRDAEPPQTHLELLSRIEPHLASFYEIVLQKPISAKERFDQLPTHYTFSEEKLEAKEAVDAAIVSPARLPTATSLSKPLRIQQTNGSTKMRMLKSVTVKAAKGDFKRAIAEGAIANPEYVLKTELIPTHSNHQSIQEIRQALINGNSQPFLDLNEAKYNTDDLKAQILKNLDWSTLKPKAPKTLKQLQEEIFNGLIGGKYYHLSFTNCIALTDNTLIAIIKDSLELQVLDVFGCEISAASIQVLATPHSLLHTLNLSFLPGLKYLSRTGFFIRELGPPLVFPQLRRLNISGCQNLLVLRLDAPNLESLRVVRCAHLFDFWRPLLSLIHKTRLSDLDLRDNQLSRAMMQSLMEALPLHFSAFNLQIDSGKNLPKFWQTIVALRMHDTRLTSVDLSFLDLGEEHERAVFEALMQALKHNRTLTLLHLSYNSLDAKAAETLTEMLKHNCTLSSLDLSFNNLGLKGEQVLAESLIYNCTLTKLDLGANNLGPHGGKVWVEVLFRNRTLISLGLSNNNLSPESVRWLAGALKLNHTLTRLDLGNNDIGPDSTQVLFEALENNYTLTSLSLDSDKLSFADTQALWEALERNKALAERKQQEQRAPQTAEIAAETKSAIAPASTISTSSETKDEKRRLSRSAFFEPAPAESTAESKAVLLEDVPPLETQTNNFPTPVQASCP